MKFERKFTRKGRGPYDGITWENRVSEIRNPQRKACFPYGQGYVPFTWSQISTIFWHKIFPVKAGFCGGIGAGFGQNSYPNRRLSSPPTVLTVIPNTMPGRFSIGSPIRGASGEETRDILIRTMMKKRFTTNSSICLPISWPRRTAPSGSTRGSTPSTASKDLPRATTTSIQPRTR